MSTEEIRLWLENNEPPFTIKTQGGRSYRVPDRTHIWHPPGYEDLICLVTPGKGLIVVRLCSIELVQLEHEAAVSR